MKIAWILLFIPMQIYAVTPLEEGNFALPASQQIGPLVSFGQNIIDKGCLQFFLFADAFIGNDNYYTDVFPGFLYGIREDLSILLNVPFSPGNQDSGSHSVGFEDVVAQLEYALYTGNYPTSSNQITLVGNMTFPSGSSTKNPPTGFGSPSFFLGATFNHTSTQWFAFTSPGVILTTSHHGTEFGNQFLYQFGLGRTFATPPGWIFAWLVELDGWYYGRNKVKGLTDPNSGGNILYVTPSLWISSDRIIVQVGVGAPIIQHWFGHQSSEYVTFDVNFGFTF